MGEDRRPNLGGYHPPEVTRPEPEVPREERELEAKLLRKRKSSDGHQPASSPSDERTGAGGRPEPK
jgi:hypothetical protein